MMRYFILFLIFPFQLAASEAEVDRLVDLLRYDELAEVLRLEAIHIEATLPDEFEVEVDEAQWNTTLEGIYEIERIEANLTAGFLGSFNMRSIEPVIDFLDSDDWVNIFDLMNAASLAMLDPETEDAAIEAYWQQEERQTKRLRQIEELLGSIDLIEQNIAGWMNSMMAFNNGMAAVDPKFALPEDEMLAFLFEDAELARQEIGEWLMAYYMLSLDPVPDVVVDRQIAFWNSQAGQDLSVGMMAGYDVVYEVSDYLVGKALVEAALGNAL